MTTEDTFQTTLENLNIALLQLEGNDKLQNCDYSLNDFLLSQKVTVSVLSSEVTKICMLYSKPPGPTVEEIEKILKNIENRFTNLVVNFSKLPRSNGKVICKKIQKAIHRILECLKDLIYSLKTTGTEGERDHARLAGCLWESCEALEDLPHNNVDAVCKELEQELELIEDALQEIEDEVNTSNSNVNGIEDTNNSEEWSADDYKLLPSCIAVVRTARSCIRRIHRAVCSKGSITDEHHIAQLDTLADRIALLSPSVDNFISSVYPPINKSTIKDTASDVVEKMLSVLAAVKGSYYVNEDDENWVEFLLKAVDHNNHKLQLLLTL